MCNALVVLECYFLARLTNGNGSVFMPRFNPQGTKLVCTEVAKVHNII